MEAYQSPLKELLRRDACPTVIVGIADDESRQHEEEVHRQIPVIAHLVLGRSGKSLKYMVYEDEQCRSPPERIQQHKMILRLYARRGNEFLPHTFILLKMTGVFYD